jgi:hypothetical protein
VYQRLMTPDGTLVAGWYRLAGDAPEPVHLIASRDGGTTWTAAGSLDHGPTYRLFPIAATGGFGVGYSTNDEVFASLDGGRTSIPSGTGVGGYNMGEPWCFDGVVLAFSDQQGGPLLCFDTVSRAWTGYRLGAPSGTTTGIAVEALAVDPADHRHVWLVGRHIGLIRTRDGGGSWQRFTLPLAAGGACLDALRRPELGLAVVSGNELLLLNDANRD